MAKPLPDTNRTIALEILDQVDRNRSGSLPLEQLEEKIWRLLDRTGPGFPVVLAGQVEEFVQSLRQLKEENRSFGNSSDVDEDRGADTIYNELVNAISRYLNG